MFLAKCVDKFSAGQDTLVVLNFKLKKKIYNPIVKTNSTLIFNCETIKTDRKVFKKNNASVV